MSPLLSGACPTCGTRRTIEPLPHNWFTEEPHPCGHHWWVWRVWSGRWFTACSHCPGFAWRTTWAAAYDHARHMAGAPHPEVP